ncbi:hypothetical protein ACIQVT_10020 [Streptomyces sp. NPDC100445]|uniref:hypothetical protein n=1 Tax=Streptomyces sp. NPDC100445 TaxID=3366102 RepID=UPI0038212EAF
MGPQKPPPARALLGCGPSATPSPSTSRPQVLAVRSGLANYGANGLADVDCTKVGRLKK